MNKLTIQNKLALLDKAEKLHGKQFAKKLWNILELPNFENIIDCSDKIFDFIASSGSNGKTKRDIVRAMQCIALEEKNKAIQKLLDNNQIIMKQEISKGNNKIKTTYFAKTKT